MKNISCLFILCLSLLVVCSCNDDTWENTGSNAADGKFTIELGKPAPPVVTTRTGNGTEQEETVESAAVFVFAADGSKTNGFVEQSSGNIRYIDVYLTDKDHSVYVVCNYPTPETLIKEVDNFEALKQRSLPIAVPDGAHPGNYVMSGHTTVEAIKGNKKTIPLYRLASRLNFSIKVNTNIDEGGDGGDFKLTEIYLCNIPKGSNLLDRAEEASVTGEEGCPNDFSYRSNPDEMRGNYFAPVRLSVQENNGETKASFDMFENRRGSMSDVAETWPELKGLEIHEKYRYYKQLFKRTRAKDYPAHIGKIAMGKETSNEELDRLPEVKEGRFYNATYLRIDGVYQSADGSSYKTSYHIYLGEDNYKDFNVKRNHLYNHTITIRAYHNFDHRVTAELLDGLTVYGTFDELDAHCNMVKALMYSPEEWTVSVKNPDETPWLEVSHSAVYTPRLLGRPATGNEAAFSISGKSGLNYFYVHTDEYIPEINHPGENVTRMQGKTRKGTIVCRSKNLTKEYEVEQLPAQIVILHIKYDVHTMKEVCDTFFIERKLEQKYMPWGFFHYWSYVTDDLIASGTWDGLSNTRKLYDVGLNGEKDKNGKVIFDPAYPNGLSYDHALGYVISKNRDRNGNGRIDYNEIVWYWPATKELQQIRTTKFDALLHFEGWEETFYASTPSSSDKAGLTPGLAVRVKMKDDSPWVPVQRDRKYNVIACRRKNAWKGPDGGGAGGNVTTNPDWDEGDEVILTKNK